jgi:histone deacetylase 1/2
MAAVEVVPTQLMEAIHSSVHLSPTPPPSALHSSSPASAPPSIPQRTHQMVTRTQTGNLKPKVFLSSRYHIPVCFLADLAAQPPEPTSYRQALQNPQWKQAMQAEMDALHANNTWTLVPRKPNMNVVSSKWVFKVKTKSNGTLDRYKARLVARGFTQLPGLDYDETFSPVVKASTIRLILTIGLSQGWTIRQLDVNNAFLHGDLQERVYLAQPPGHEDPALPQHVCLLHKALYGLKQAPRAWYMKFSNYIQSMGFLRCPYDQSLFYQRQGSDILLLLIYVDDILITGSSPSQISAFISHLSSVFSMKDLGDIHYFLGLQIARDATTITVTQTRYLVSLLQKFSLAGAKPVATPLASGTLLTATEGALLSDPTFYRQLVGSLQYLTLTRPDISYSVHRVCQYMHAPREPHLIVVKRIFRYLKGTLTLGLHLVHTPLIALHGFCDADWAGCHDDRRSTSGFAIYMGNNLLSWGAKKQATVSRSTAEAEYRALASTTAELMWFMNLLQSIGYCLPPPKLYCDNISAVTMAKNPVFHHRTKHIEIDVHFVRERVASGDLLLEHVAGPDQIADIFTKSLCSAKFVPNRDKLFIGSLPP